MAGDENENILIHKPSEKVFWFPRIRTEQRKQISCHVKLQLCGTTDIEMIFQNALYKKIDRLNDAQ